MGIIQQERNKEKVIKGVCKENKEKEEKVEFKVKHKLVMLLWKIYPIVVRILHKESNY